MKHFLTILLLAACAATGYGQTVKSLGYNTGNGEVVAATNVVWTNSFSFSTNTVAAQVRTNLGLGFSALTNTNAANFRTAIGLGDGDEVTFMGITLFDAGDQFAIGTDPSFNRDQLGLGLPALTNTNNADFRDAIELGATNNVTFSNVAASGTLTATGAVTLVTNLNVGGAIAVTNAAETRTNLGLPWEGLTGTNSSDFLVELRIIEDINSTNLVSVTAANHLYDETGEQPSLRGDDGEFFTAASFVTTNAPADTTNATRWLILKEGTNSYRIPLFQ